MLKEGFSKALLKWHFENARVFPWRGETDAYRIWLSEIMLQQTRTETVKGYYLRFLAAFPDVYSLAEADESRVLKMWEGLGYYSRARNLLKAARIVAFEMNGKFPDTADALKKLPGIGDYVAGAVSSIAFNRREPALDGNQARVISRIYNVKDVIKTPAYLRAKALLLMPDTDFGEYNQALMGLGAMICISGRPKCEACPVREYCDAYLYGNPSELPVKMGKNARKIERRAIALVFSKSGVLMRKRTDPLLEGMWEFPGFTDAKSAEDVKACLEEMGVYASYQGKAPNHKHVFTHLEWHMTGYRFTLESGGEEYAYLTAEDIKNKAVPTALKPYREEAIRIIEEKENEA